MITTRRLLICALCTLAIVTTQAQQWPKPLPEAKAGTRRWWMGSAVDRQGLEWNLSE